MLSKSAILKHVNHAKPLSPITIKKKENNLTNADKTISPFAFTGSAETLYSGTQSISTTQDQNGNYILLDDSRGGGIHTLNANSLGNPNTGEVTSFVTEFKDNDNNWTKAEHYNTEVRASNQQALDVHWASNVIYDYWKNVHNRNSYDNQGAKITSYVHFSDRLDNAAWNGTHMIYGDGSQLKPLVSLDIAAHEIGHAIATAVSDLAYEGENGAINEALSDIWGAVIEHYKAPEKKTWIIGEEIFTDGSGIRSINDPKSLSQPDTYLGQLWINADPATCNKSDDHCGVHTNSGVINHFFYILSQGKSGTNDAGNIYNITGIGIDKAAEIVYRAENTYLTSQPTFMDFRNMMIQSATDLYGATSTETSTVIDSFYAVNIGNPNDSENPTDPTNLQAEKIRSVSATLKWNASTDNYQVKGYKVYQDNVEINDVAATTIDIFDLVKGTTYNFTVEAYDNNGNKSNKSNILTFTTPSSSTDTEKPTAPVVSITKTGATNIAIKWTTSTDNDQLRDYVIYLDGQQYGTASNTATETVITPVTANSSHSIYMKARDYEENYSDNSNTVSTQTFAGEYCSPVNLINMAFYKINSINIGDFTIDSNSGTQFAVEQNKPSADFTFKTIDLKAGNSYNGTLDVSTFFPSNTNVHVYVWADLNRDSVFNEFTETLHHSTVQFTSYAPQIIPINFTIPTDTNIQYPTAIRVGFVQDFTPSVGLPNTTNLPCGNIFTYFNNGTFLANIEKFLGTDDVKTDNTPLVYPNPTTDVLYVKNGKSGDQYIIYNTSGQIVSSGNYNSGINVNKLTKRMYIISIEKNGVKNTSKFLKK